jgi:putative heme iron utilization protein
MVYSVPVFRSRSGRFFRSKLGTPRNPNLPERVIMTEKDLPAAVLREIQIRLDKKVKENEIAAIEYWKALVDRAASMKPDGIASLQLQIKKISEMMENRIRVLKRP